MGMAASQARLLTITARLADNELRSQTINNAKMRLATQSSQASENYINALNAATMKFSNYDEAGVETIQNLTYNALTAYSSYNTQYGLVNSSGQILVSEAEAKLFKEANGNVNAYLKAHGLEFNTSYFSKVGALENAEYPAPYNLIETETLQKYYEEYDSYENSIEVEKFEREYGEYKASISTLQAAAHDSMKKYLYATSNSPLISYANGDTTVVFANPSGSLSSKLAEIKNGFQGANGNTYNINKLAASGFITAEGEAKANELLDTASINGDGAMVIGEDMMEAIQHTINTDGSITYTIDDFTITTDSNGKVISGATAVTGADLTFSAKSGSLSTGVSLSAYLNNLKVKAKETDEDGTTYESDYTYVATAGDENDSVPFLRGLVQQSLITNADEIEAAIIGLADDVITTILQYTNYDSFADWLCNTDVTLLKNSYGIDTEDPIEKCGGKTLKEILENYENAKDHFFKTIFHPDDVATALALVNSGAIASEDLTDVENILRIMKQQNLRPSETFNTVIKDTIVELMIEEYGEPKYAWVDVNDINNTGNADAKAQWYTNLFERMRHGYKALENGLASSAKWIEYAFASGIVTMEQVDKSFNWISIDHKTCSRITEETDKDAITVAEAQYTRAMNDIEAKDNIYDLQLKNIDTEHNALQTELDVIKGVIDKNISRTFKFNQSA